MKKWIIIGGAVAIFIIILIVVGISNLGPIVKSAVNTYGPKITKTEVRLEDVDISIFSGEARLKDFCLGNPKGFKSPQAIKVGSIYVDVDEGSLAGETIIIDKIEVVRPEITYEKAHQTDNFKTILNNVKSTVGTKEPPKKQPEKESGGKKILIRNFIVRDGKVNLTMSMLARNWRQSPTRSRDCSANKRDHDHGALISYHYSREKPGIKHIYRTPQTIFRKPVFAAGLQGGASVP